MSKMLSAIKGKVGKGIAMLSLGVGLMSMAAATHAAGLADEFTASSTEADITALFANITPVLKWGVIGIVGIGLTLWVIFLIVKKFKQHVK